MEGGSGNTKSDLVAMWRLKRQGKKGTDCWRCQPEAAVVDLVSLKRAHPISEADTGVHRQWSSINQLILKSGDSEEHSW